MRRQTQFGSVEWELLFSHLISLRDQVVICDTVYLLVDDRDMRELEATKQSIPRWPPAAAWWASRVQLIGPYCERTDVVSIHICEDTGLADVHPTGAGAFVLAAMVALYPNIHFVLIDNDCLPLTLFEITELWHLASPDDGNPTPGDLHPSKRARIGPEPSSGSDPFYRAPFRTECWPCRGLCLPSFPYCGFGVFGHACGYQCGSLCTSPQALRGYRHLLKGYLGTCLSPSALSSDLASTWLQTGLALTPFAFAETRYSVDWALAWTMIGEWTIHHRPPASGKWPRFAQVGGLEELFRHRHPSLVTWARACFEQGALPSLSVLPGAVEVRSLPGDMMFQATHVVDGFQRPCVLHGYGGAKSSMPCSLPALARSGWTVLAAALLGTNAKPPLWTQDGFRPVIGTTVDSRISPYPVSFRKQYSFTKPGLQDRYFRTSRRSIMGGYCEAWRIHKQS